MRPTRRLGVALVLAAVATRAGAGEWTCHPRGEDRVLLFEGNIEAGEFKRFRAAFSGCFDRYAGQRTLALRSDGGSVGEALAIAQALLVEGQSRLIKTWVEPERYCISACTFLFLAGGMRDVANGGTFEPHGFSAFLGPRIDAAIGTANVNEANGYDLERLELLTPRLSILSKLLLALALADDRFDFARHWIESIFGAESRPEFNQRALRGYFDLSAAQRKLIADLDGVLSTILPEIEREAALKAFEPVISQAERRRLPELDEGRHAAWITHAVGKYANHYLRAINAKGGLRRGEDLPSVARAIVSEIAAGSADAVRTGLSPYFATRADDVDIPGLVRLMFSVSILYTRPLTREEMCDLGVMNIRQRCWD